jgi:hypothetical protein
LGTPDSIQRVWNELIGDSLPVRWYGGLSLQLIGGLVEDIMCTDTACDTPAGLRIGAPEAGIHSAYARVPGRGDSTATYYQFTTPTESCFLNITVTEGRVSALQVFCQDDAASASPN